MSTRSLAGSKSPAETSRRVGSAPPSRGYGAGLFFEWNLFEGGATQRKVELAEAERRAAEDEVIGGPR